MHLLRSKNEDDYNTMCLTGSYHAKRTNDLRRVTCVECLERAHHVVRPKKALDRYNRILKKFNLTISKFVFYSLMTALAVYVMIKIVIAYLYAINNL